MSKILVTRFEWINGFEAVPAKNGYYHVMTRLNESDKFEIRTFEWSKNGWNTTEFRAESRIDFTEEDYDEVWWYPQVTYGVHD